MMQTHKRRPSSERSGIRCLPVMSIQLVDTLSTHEVRGREERKSQSATDAHERANTVGRPGAEKTEQNGKHETEKGKQNSSRHLVTSERLSCGTELDLNNPYASVFIECYQCGKRVDLHQRNARRPRRLGDSPRKSGSLDLRIAERIQDSRSIPPAVTTVIFRALESSRSADRSPQGMCQRRSMASPDYAESIPTTRLRSDLQASLAWRAARSNRPNNEGTERRRPLIGRPIRLTI